MVDDNPPTGGWRTFTCGAWAEVVCVPRAFGPDRLESGLRCRSHGLRMPGWMGLKSPADSGSGRAGWPYHRAGGDRPFRGAGEVPPRRAAWMASSPSLCAGNRCSRRCPSGSRLRWPVRKVAELDPDNWSGLEHLEALSGPGAIAELVQDFRKDVPKRPPHRRGLPAPAPEDVARWARPEINARPWACGFWPGRRPAGGPHGRATSMRRPCSSES